jgi:hypothetical protein
VHDGWIHCAECMQLFGESWKRLFDIVLHRALFSHSLVSSSHGLFTAFSDTLQRVTQASGRLNATSCTKFSMYSAACFCSLNVNIRIGSLLPQDVNELCILSQNSCTLHRKGYVTLESRVDAVGQVSLLIVRYLALQACCSSQNKQSGTPNQKCTCLNISFTSKCK